MITYPTVSLSQPFAAYGLRQLIASSLTLADNVSWDNSEAVMARHGRWILPTHHETEMGPALLLNLTLFSECLGSFSAYCGSFPERRILFSGRRRLPFERFNYFSWRFRASFSLLCIESGLQCNAFLSQCLIDRGHHGILGSLQATASTRRQKIESTLVCMALKWHMKH